MTERVTLGVPPIPPTCGAWPGGGETGTVFVNVSQTF